MPQFGLIGFPLAHSFSANYFNEKFSKIYPAIQDVSYHLFALNNIKQVRDLIKNNPELCGLNVTHPYKNTIIQYLDSINNIAKEIGAVNTIKIFKNQDEINLVGYNTDCYGFEKMLEPLLQSHHQKALILGTGGVSKAVQFIFKKNSINYTLVSQKRSNQDNIHYDDLTKKIVEQHLIVINATPVGMFPNITEYPNFPYHFLNQRHLVIDLIYNPPESQFIKFSKKSGATTKNGLDMFHYQAEKAWEIWCA